MYNSRDSIENPESAGQSKLQNNFLEFTLISKENRPKNPQIIEKSSQKTIKVQENPSKNRQQSFSSELHLNLHQKFLIHSNNERKNWLLLLPNNSFHIVYSKRKIISTRKKENHQKIMMKNKIDIHSNKWQKRIRME
jgi:hypothetical protein